VHFRPLEQNDLARLQVLTRLSEAEGFRFLRRFVIEWQAVPDYVASNANFFLGVVVAEELVAIGGITPDPYVQESTVGRVRHMYVHPAYRRRGIGRALLQELEQYACTRFRHLRLRTDTASAAAFYTAADYRPINDPTATHVRDCFPDAS
jgi:GNAT superfamily N-acetyltransferase